MPIFTRSPPSTISTARKKRHPASSSSSPSPSLLHRPLPKNSVVRVDDAGGFPAFSHDDHHQFHLLNDDEQFPVPPRSFLNRDSFSASKKVAQEPVLDSPSFSQYYLSALSESLVSARSYTDAVEEWSTGATARSAGDEHFRISGTGDEDERSKIGEIVDKDERFAISDAGDDECFRISDVVDSSPSSLTSRGGGEDGDGENAADDCSASRGGPSHGKKPHNVNDERWEAIRAVQSSDGYLRLSHFRLLWRLGRGDIGIVYLAELSRTGTLFAMKVMDKAVLARKKKLKMMQTEREVLQSIDHPFLPTLYAHFETDEFSCLVTEFCPGGDLLALRKRQPRQHFSEKAARFYAAEVLLALEYLHMLGIIYRDLKPENILVREDGHIMLADFDLSLRCGVLTALVKSKKVALNSGSCIESFCKDTTCFSRKYRRAGRSKSKKPNPSDVRDRDIPLPELIAEPREVRSMSYVGTHEYLAPEIIKGGGHGSAVDWWTFGVFLFELLYGKTPFRGSGNRATLLNVIREPLKFPDYPAVSLVAKDMIRGLLVKEPHKRLGYKHGAAEIKQHLFFQSINWSLIRCRIPPEVPMAINTNNLTARGSQVFPHEDSVGVDVRPPKHSYMDFF